MIFTHDLADAIVAFLQAKSHADDVIIARRRIVYADLSGISGKVVSVIPYGPDLTLAAVGMEENSVDIRIVVQCKLAGDTDGLLADSAAELAESIAAGLVGTRLMDCDCQSAKMLPAYDPTKLATLDTFDAMIFTTWLTDDECPDD